MRKAPPVFATSLNIESGCVCVSGEAADTGHSKQTESQAKGTWGWASRRAPAGKHI